MFIVPFTHTIVNNNDFNVNVIKILTIGGKDLWQENASLRIDDDILNPNDIYRTNDIINYDNNLQLCEVDCDKTNMSDFYKWEEVNLGDRDTFCWKTYYYFAGTNKSSWLDVPNEKIGKYSIRDIINAIVKKK